MATTSLGWAANMSFRIIARRQAVKVWLPEHLIGSVVTDLRLCYGGDAAADKFDLRVEGPSWASFLANLALLQIELKVEHSSWMSKLVVHLRRKVGCVPSDGRRLAQIQPDFVVGRDELKGSVSVHTPDQVQVLLGANVTRPRIPPRTQENTGLRVQAIGRPLPPEKEAVRSQRNRL